MPYAKNGDVNIYYEVEGEGTPLVLAYGLTGGLNCWRMMEISDLLINESQLILFDARGHGKSDKPYEVSEYGLNMAGDVVAVLDDIGIEKVHYFGYSLGAKVGYWLAIRHIARFHSFILGGASPYHNKVEIKLQDELLREMKELLESNDKDALRSNDAQALVALVTAFDDVPPLTDHELSLISVPVLVFCGDADPRYAGARDSANHMPKATFLPLSGLNHIQADVCISPNYLALSHVKEFLARVSK